MTRAWNPDQHAEECAEWTRRHESDLRSWDRAAKAWEDAVSLAAREWEEKHKDDVPLWEQIQELNQRKAWRP